MFRNDGKDSLVAATTVPAADVAAAATATTTATSTITLECGT